MLYVEKLICKNKKFHKDCNWVRVPIRYPDTRYLLLKKRLISEVTKTKIAYRILHHRLWILTTIKFGHDGVIFVHDNEDAIRNMALLPAKPLGRF